MKPKHPKIPLTEVKSGLIQAIGHDPATKTLAVQFKGGSLYHYAGFDAEEFAKLQAAESIGSHFGKHVRPSFTHTKVD